MSYSLILNKNGMGDAPQDLRLILIKSYFGLLVNEEQIPSFICCYGEGVHLCCTGSPIIEELYKLQERGCIIIVCKTCLHFLQRTEEVETGTVGSMMDILGVQMQSAKLITL